MGSEEEEELVALSTSLEQEEEAGGAGGGGGGGDGNEGDVRQRAHVVSYREQEASDSGSSSGSGSEDDDDEEEDEFGHGGGGSYHHHAPPPPAAQAPLPRRVVLQPAGAAFRDAQLRVAFEGETGHGSGPSQEFFSLVCRCVFVFCVRVGDIWGWVGYVRWMDRYICKHSTHVSQPNKTKTGN